MKQKEILWILISAFVLVLAWIGLSIYHNLATSTISEPLSLEISPITPAFDSKTIDELKGRKAIQPVFEIQKGAGEEKTATISGEKATSSLPPPLPGQKTEQKINISP